MPIQMKTLSITGLLRTFWRPISITWCLTIAETTMLVAMPLLIGKAIDGLVLNNWSSFSVLIGTMISLLLLAVGRRVYDTRAYGTMGVKFSMELIERSKKNEIKNTSVSVLNARLGMGSELVEFLELQAPLMMVAVIQLVVTIAILLTYDSFLALSAGTATAILMLIYSMSSSRFFKLNRLINQRVEQQVNVLEGGSKSDLKDHLSALRRHAVQLSDTEAIVYGLIFLVLLTMLAFNLWFASTQIGATVGQIFSIVTYSFQLIDSAVTIPATLQSLTRLSEITQRINNATEA